MNLKKLVLSLDAETDNPYLYTRGDVGDGEPKLQQYKYRESKQSNSLLTEENANSAFMNTSNENAVFNLSFEPHLHVQQLGNLLSGLPLGCLTTAVLYTSEAPRSQKMKS
ncbi:hypothetical protein AVEN_1279-1 [Araneus ventricosus]|uniref:Uncharacterized protein n=1 Tax=Araneus ventricosus TaxID=182803 RepID=A0A4Y2STP3_ARAVE|nr:hypothetical protein AVEN_1279-1 [Araneus ventricosus]